MKVLTGKTPSGYCKIQLPGLTESTYREFKITGRKLTFYWYNDRVNSYDIVKA
jgi:hypothetical protein